MGGKIVVDDNNCYDQHYRREAVRTRLQARVRVQGEETMSMDAIRRDDPDSLFATPAIVAERRADGATLVRSTTPLRPAA